MGFEICFVCNYMGLFLLILSFHVCVHICVYAERLFYVLLFLQILWLII
jgi:hypothetical protein